MPLSSQFPVNPIVVNSDVVSKTLVPENPKVKKMDKSSKNAKEEGEDSEKTKEKQRSKQDLSKDTQIDVTI